MDKSKLLWEIQFAMKEYYKDPQLMNELTIEQHIADHLSNRLELLVKPQGELLLCERNKSIEECVTFLEEEANRIFELKEKESSILSEITQDYFDMESEIRKNCAVGLRTLILPTEKERRAEEESTWQN